MYRRFAALFAAVLVLLLCTGTVQAQDYAVPLTVGSRSYTLTVSVIGSAIQVTSSAPEVKIGAVQPAVTLLTPTISVTTAAETAVQAASVSDLQKQMATAVTIAYDDLFRNNEQHIGKVVRYVGQVLEYGDQVCLLCDDPGHYLRVGVTPLSYTYDDPIYVLYEGDQRFLEDDIVTVWGTVDGLESYIAVLGNEVTIPRLQALDVVLGEVSNPKLAGQPGQPSANRDANLRSGPGTTFAVIGSVDAGQALAIVARNQDASWFLLDSGDWIAAFLVDRPPALADTPLAAELPQPATAASESVAVTAAAPVDTPGTPAEQPAASGGSSIVSIGQEIEAGGWRFKVTEVHKRKAVYFYDESYVAMGHFLIVLLEATNLQSGTDYFAHNIEPWITDDPGNVYSLSGTGSGYARWQYGGLTSIYTDVNPGNFARIAIAYDLPDATGRVLLSTDVGKWVDLGDFSALASEDN